MDLNRLHQYQINLYCLVIDLYYNDNEDNALYAIKYDHKTLSIEITLSYGISVKLQHGRTDCALFVMRVTLWPNFTLSMLSFHKNSPASNICASMKNMKLCSVFPFPEQFFISIMN